MKYVIGSGPAGVACAYALVQNGQPVTILDAGKTLPESARKRKKRMLEDEVTVEDDTHPAVRTIKKTVIQTVDDGVPYKSYFGSDMPYNTDENRVRTDQYTPDSFAKGGFSTVWGGQMLPYRSADLKGWPLNVADLAPHYRIILDQLVPMATQPGGLDDQYPLYTDRYTHLEISDQIKSLLGDLDPGSGSDELPCRRVGVARRALDTTVPNGCAYCGLDLYGSCPHEATYTAADTLDELKDHKLVTYRPDHRVHTVRETDQGAVIKGKETTADRQKPFQIKADRVFVGAGAFQTSMIGARSFGHASVRLRTTPHFMMPFLYTKNPRRNLAANGGGEGYLEFMGPDGTAVHCELNPSADVYKNLLEQKPPSRYLPSFARDYFARRFILLQGFMHSRHGQTMKLVNKNGDFTIQGSGQYAEQVAVYKALATIVRETISPSFMPLLPTPYNKPLNRRHHIGGSFPMGEEADTLGRPNDKNRIHFIDASTFPTVPAPTITLSIMANAHRIGTKAARHDPS